MRFAVILILLFHVLDASAQDEVIKRNGTVIRAKVLEVNETAIRYKNWENINGPDYVLSKNEIQEVRYENGSVDVFELNIKQAPNFSKYDSLIRLSQKKKARGIIALSIAGGCAFAGTVLVAYGVENNASLAGLGSVFFAGMIPAVIIGSVQMHKAKKYQRIANSMAPRLKVAMPDVGLNNFKPNGSFAFSIHTTISF